MEALEKDRNGLLTKINQEFEVYEKSIYLDEDRKSFTALVKSWKEFVPLNDKTIKESQKNNKAEAYELYLQSQSELKGVLDSMNFLVKLNHDGAIQSSNDSNNAYNSGFTLMLIFIAASIAIGAGIAFFLTRAITKPLSMVTDSISEVSRGNLTIDPIMVSNQDELGQLARSTNEMVIHLRSLIKSVLESSQNVAAASQQISASSEEIAGGAMSQANSAQSVNELFRELSIVIDSVAKNAETSADLSIQAKEVAGEGGAAIASSIAAMTQVEKQMSLLQEDSDKIGEIIAVIDDIADQTNLLALNAAIEAARAGEQGKGFAVVADEVRKLAERSGKATKEIGLIISGIQKNTLKSVDAVNHAAALSEKIGTAFENIVSKVNETATQVNEIAAASEEQAAQASEVLGAVETIAAASEEAAAAAEETATSTQSLARMAEELNSSVSAFKIN
jgi:methyl-accepting chemotaxis protein